MSRRTLWKEYQARGLQEARTAGCWDAVSGVAETAAHGLNRCGMAAHVLAQCSRGRKAYKHSGRAVFLDALRRQLGEVAA